MGTGAGLHRGRPSTVNGIDKLGLGVKALWGKNIPWCHTLGYVRLVADECEPSPALAEVVKEVDKLLELCRQQCVVFDNLRSKMGTLERERGAKNPLFWEGKINDSSRPVRCCQFPDLK